MKGVLFRIDNGKAYFDDGKGYGLEECIGILDGLVNVINTGVIQPSVSQEQSVLLKNVVNYEDVLDKRIIAGDNSKSTQKLKQWLDNDPEVLAEDGVDTNKMG
jgi:hypothetical protein